MMTEDAIRRRELAGVGIKAEVEGDEFRIVVTLDRPTFDALVKQFDEPLNDPLFDEDDAYTDGHDEGYADAIRQIKALAAEQANAESKTA